MEALGQLFTPALAAAGAIAFVGAIMRGFTGFGANLVMAPVFVFLYGPVATVQMLMVISIIGAIQIVIPAARIIDWRANAPLLLGTVVFTPVGIAALLYAEPDLVRRAIGAFVVASAVVMMTGWSYKGPRGPWIGGAVGGLGGFISGFAGVGGPVPVLYYMSAPDEARVQRAHNVISVGIPAPVGLIAFLISGTLNAHTFVLGLLITIPYMAGMWMGAHLFSVARPEVFRWVVLALLAAVGVAALVF